ncbi:hypothetical protein HBD59_000024 [Salmonella enterica]|nr:hypothetical protein [Salmonella enterica]EGY4577545.1 hypothetical protein [Salmonella enterica]EGY4584369.1 hypothetical protein [Salmonella enterica]EGY9841629.1 hypothetical protein [Salmonella enterica]EIG1197419.1 hypothetical protein [Salmonella enterica]
MNMIHKSAISGAMLLTSMTATATPIDPESLSSEATVITTVKINSSGTAPEATWEPRTNLTDDIEDGATVGVLKIHVFPRSKICFKTDDADVGNFNVRTEDKRYIERFKIEDTPSAISYLYLETHYDTTGCTTDDLSDVVLDVAKVGKGMNPGVYLGHLFVAAMMN